MSKDVMTDEHNGRQMPRPSLKVKVRLVVLDFDGPADAITAVLGVPPTTTWRTGERRVPEATILHKQNGWMIRSPADPLTAAPEEAVLQLLARIPDPTAFRRLPPSVEVQLTVTVYGLGDRPFVFLSADTVAKLASMGASLDIDTYDLSAAE